VDEQSLLGDICRILCDEAGYRMAWVGYGERDDVQIFINEMVAKYQYDRNQLGYWMEMVTPQTAILETIAKPAEGKSWKEYRPIFMSNERIQQGVAFWKINKEILQRAGVSRPIKTGKVPY